MGLTGLVRTATVSDSADRAAGRSSEAEARRPDGGRGDRPGDGGSPAPDGDDDEGELAAARGRGRIRSFPDLKTAAQSTCEADVVDVAAFRERRAARETTLAPAAVAGVAAGINDGRAAGGLGAPEWGLPVIPELAALLPGGALRRGSTVAASGATSLLIGLLTAASRAGSWCAVVGMPMLGAVAAAEAGIALDRLALVPHPGADWSAVVAALLDGIDVVVAAPPGPVAGALTGRLAARARQRGSVLIAYGRWPGADVTLDSTRGRWEGLDGGAGRLRKREMTVVAGGRGAAARGRQATFWLPDYAPINEGWSVDGWRERNGDTRPRVRAVPKVVVTEIRREKVVVTEIRREAVS
jgi:hypothetical protein